MAARRVGLALGSGGARGYAHIGALQVLSERGFEVTAISGTSMGALIGGVTAAGKLEEYTEWATSLTQREVLRLLDPTLAGGGAVRAERVITAMADMIGDVLIEDLEIPYTAVATDLEAGREVWFQDGPLETAIRASIAIPSLITPIVVDGRLLVDGGVCNPVPIEPLAATASDFTVAVALSGPRRTGLRTESTSPVRTIAQSLRALSTRFRRDDDGEDEADREEEPPYRAAPRATSPMEMLNRSFDAMTSQITRFRMAAIPPDVLVTVPVDACRMTDFHKADEMIAMGRELTEQALDAAGLGNAVATSGEASS